MSVDVRPVAGRQGAARVHRAPVPAALYLAVLDPPAAHRAPAVPQPAPERVLQARRRASCSCAWRDGRVVGRISAQIDHAFNAYQRQPLGDVRLPGVRGRPRDPAGAARRRRGLAARARARPDDRADGLRDQRRERRARRGLRPRADDQAALAPALLRGALRGGRPGEGRWTCGCGSSTSPTATKILPIVFELAEQVEPKHGVHIRKMSRRSLRRDMDRFAEVYNSAWAQQLGLRRPTPRRTSTTTPRSCSSSSTRRGSWSPRRTARRSRWRSRSPTSTRCSRR